MGVEIQYHSVGNVRLKASTHTHTHTMLVDSKRDLVLVVNARTSNRRGTLKGSDEKFRYVVTNPGTDTKLKPDDQVGKIRKEDKSDRI